MRAAPNPESDSVPNQSSGSHNLMFVSYCKEAASRWRRTNNDMNVNELATLWHPGGITSTRP